VDVHEELVAFGADEFFVDIAQVDWRPWQVGLFGNVVCCYYCGFHIVELNEC